MTDRPKLSVTFARKQNVGNYSHIEVSATKEFYADETTVGSALDDVGASLDGWLRRTGLLTNLNVKIIHSASDAGVDVKTEK